MHVNETSRGDHLAMHTNTNHYAAPRTNMMVYIDYISVKLEENPNLCMYVHSSITHNQKRANHLNAQQLVNGRSEPRPQWSPHSNPEDPRAGGATTGAHT